MIQFLRTGGFAAGLLVGVGLVASANLNPRGRGGDVIVAGSVIVDPAVKAVQHPTGGIVSEVRRRSGDRVKSGELLIRLDDSAIRSDILVSSIKLDRLAARRARIEAERDEQSTIAFPPALLAGIGNPAVRSAIDDEQRVFAVRVAARKSEQELQEFRIKLLEDEIDGLKVQEQSKAAEAVLIEGELNGVRTLHNQSLAPIPRLNALERDAIQIDSEKRGSIPVGIAQANGRIADAKLEILRSERDYFRDAANELREVDDRFADLARRKADFEAQLHGAEILSPEDGIILSSAVAQAGCPVAAGENLMYIAPSDEKPSVEAKVDAVAARTLRVGQSAKLVVEKGSASSELAGWLDRISPTALTAGSGRGEGTVTLRFALAPEAQADLSALPPGTAVRISIAAPGNRGLLDLMPTVVWPLHRIERAML